MGVVISICIKHPGAQSLIYVTDMYMYIYVYNI
jgi:hypothetical protein